MKNTSVKIADNACCKRDNACCKNFHAEVITSEDVYNRSLFAIFTQVKNTSSHAHKTGSWYLLGFLYTNFNWRAPPLCSLNHLLARDCRSQTDLEILLKGLSRMITDVVWIKSELFYCEKSQRWTARKLYPIQCCLIANPCFQFVKLFSPVTLTAYPAGAPSYGLYRYVRPQRIEFSTVLLINWLYRFWLL